MFDKIMVAVGGSFERAPWGWGLLALLVGGWFKLKPVLTELANKREKDLLQERADEMASMRDHISALEKRLDLAYEEMRVLRHDLANANHALDLFMELIEANPEKAAEHAKRVKVRRDAGRAQIGEEKVALARARTQNIVDHP
ncbi:hypothetical protein GCM10022280_12610 [Sphingomonas swuensis]|uniref:Uncharacterized protein n=1 Tax=Sphingomonas swuensis TaxID=977800 RepID=A0ABP7SRS5_9SPHN